MDKAKLVELAERCEAATGPDRELDADICIAALGWSEIPSEEGNWRSLTGPNGRVNVTRKGSNGGFAGDKLPGLTASLDAAMTLVPDGHWYCIGREDSGPWARCYDVAKLFEAPEEYGDLAEAATPALAICAAALRSHAQPK